ncbi:MAG: AsnC family transcriptional regulator [Thermoplasmatales archaeon]|nr:MAG: AsnC family transcriptional regulator [Thermoplasmatales archaeon]
MNLDSIDIKILEILQKDGRASFREIAKELGITTPTVSKKVDTFKKLDLLKGFSANLDAEKLDEITILLYIKCKPTDTRKVLDQLRKTENVRELYGIDGSRIYAKVTITDKLNDFLTGLGEIKEIMDYEYHTITETVKEKPRAILSYNLKLTVPCYYCKKLIKDEPVKIKMDGRNHYLCCNTCVERYEKKYKKLKENIS